MVVLCSIGAKRRLVAPETAIVAVGLARQKIQRDVFQPLVLEALTCTVKVINFDLRPF